MLPQSMILLNFQPLHIKNSFIEFQTVFSSLFFKSSLTVSSRIIMIHLIISLGLSSQAHQVFGIAHYGLVKAMVFPVVMYGCESWTVKKLSAKEMMLLNCGFGEGSWESLGLQGDPTRPSSRRSILGVHWRHWCWSWNSSTLATWCEELTHLRRPWCWERLRAGGAGEDRGWVGWMASLTRWTWVWMYSGSWWWTGRPGVLWFMGSQKFRHDCMTELNWLRSPKSISVSLTV